MASDFTELMIWQRASEILRDAVMDIESFERRVGSRQIGDQLFRSASSISANIAEGFGRRSTKEFTQSLVVARGELDETRNWYYQCRNLSLLDNAVVESRMKTLLELRKMVNAFIGSLKRGKPQPNS